MVSSFTAPCLVLLLSFLPLALSQPGVNLVPFVESVNIVEEAFESSHCAVQEGSLGNEISGIPPYWNGFINRKLLRFSVGIQNKGWADLKLNRQEHPEWFEWGACHNHWHFKDFTHYELLQNGYDIVTGRKQAFCLMDIRKVDRYASSRPNHSCGNPGISAGWADVYSYTLDGQWIDVTDVPPGSYTLRVTVNHGYMLEEDNYADNSITTSVVIPGVGGYRSGAITAPNQCNRRGRDCASSEDCCTEICAHTSGEIKTSPTQRTGGRCACVRTYGRCAGDQNCCAGNTCDIRYNQCVPTTTRPQQQPGYSRNPGYSPNPSYQQQRYFPSYRQSSRSRSRGVPPFWRQ